MLKLRDASPSQPDATAAVFGLDAGRKRAGKQSRRRRRANTVKNGVAAVVLIGILGAACYVGWEAYQDSRRSEVVGDPVYVPTNEALERLQNKPAWNGPGNPTFGVGSDQP